MQNEQHGGAPEAGWKSPRGLTGGAADVDPQSQAAVAVVMGGRGYGERKHRKAVSLGPPVGIRCRRPS